MSWGTFWQMNLMTAVAFWGLGHVLGPKLLSSSTDTLWDGLFQLLHQNIAEAGQALRSAFPVGFVALLERPEVRKTARATRSEAGLFATRSSRFDCGASLIGDAPETGATLSSRLVT